MTRKNILLTCLFSIVIMFTSYFVNANAVKFGQEAESNHNINSKDLLTRERPSIKLECVRNSDCASGTKCVANACQATCTGVTCPNGQSCNPSNGKCDVCCTAPANGYCSGCTSACNSGYKKSGSSCVPLCTGVTCSNGQGCNASTGTCQSCCSAPANGSCSGCTPVCNSGYKMSGSACVPLCTGVTCPNGQTCNTSTGACQSCCSAPTNGSCEGCTAKCNSGYSMSGSICVLDNPCSGKTCPTNAYCSGGDCYCNSGYIGSSGITVNPGFCTSSCIPPTNGYCSDGVRYCNPGYIGSSVGGSTANPANCLLIGSSGGGSSGGGTTPKCSGGTTEQVVGPSGLGFSNTACVFDDWGMTCTHYTQCKSGWCVDCNAGWYKCGGNGNGRGSTCR